MIYLEFLMLAFLIFCAIATVRSKSLLSSIVIFMAFSAVMSLIWLILESPDLAITEAAVGAGVSSILFFVTLRKIQGLEEGGSNEQNQR